MTKNFIVSLFILSFAYLIKSDESKITAMFSKIDSPVENIVWCGSDRVITDDDETILVED